jgi:hypothetical protein
LSALIGGKFIFRKKNPLQDLLSSLNAVISTNESTVIITGHVIYNLAYTYKFQLKTTKISAPQLKTFTWHVQFHFGGFHICNCLAGYVLYDSFGCPSGTRMNYFE